MWHTCTLHFPLISTTIILLSQVMNTTDGEIMLLAQSRPTWWMNADVRWSHGLFVDTGTSYSQVIRTPAPVRRIFFVWPLVHLNLEENWPGNHVLHSTLFAYSFLDELGLPAFFRIISGKRRKEKTAMNTWKGTWRAGLMDAGSGINELFLFQLVSQKQLLSSGASNAAVLLHPGSERTL